MSQKKTGGVSRRAFVAGSASTVFAINYFPGKLLGAEAPSNKLNIAGIGVGGQGGGNVRICSGSENIVALCDVDDVYAAHTFKRHPKAAVYKDYRVMLEKQKDIDAVVIGTPDHTHAVITLASMQLGKHVYCQKPLTHTVHEARVLTAAASKYKVQTQMGNQGHSWEPIRLLKEWIQSGEVGDVTEIHAWSDRPIGIPSYANFAVRELPKGDEKIPSTLDWDLWLGPAAMRAYSAAYTPFKWRGFLDFGTGALGDMGCHILDPSFYALDLGNPVTVQAEVEHVKPELSPHVFPISSKVIYNFPARGKMPPVKLTWFDGHFKVPRPPMLEPDRPLPESGAIIYGSKETLMHDSHGASGLRVIPETRMQNFKRPPKTIARVKGKHEEDWIRACKDGNPASSTFEYGGPLTEMVLLGVIAMRVPNEKLEWSSEKMQFTNSAKANEYVKATYRQGWSL
jgi:predicted dehydrogenase